MSVQEFKILLQKYIDQKITKEELLRLEEFASRNPEYKKEYDQYRSVIQGIKSSALREELKDTLKPLIERQKLLRKTVNDSGNFKIPDAFKEGRELWKSGEGFQA